MKHQGALWITATAVFVALLIGVQTVTAPLGQLVTGSLVNLVLIVCVTTCGFTSGLTVAILSPVFAKCLGIGPFWPLIPFIIIGNIVLISLWHTLSRQKFAAPPIMRIITLIAAAAGKFAALYLGIVCFAVPFLLGLPEKQAAMISGMFSAAQLLTALTGGVLALLILPVVEHIRATGRQTL